jgi:uncharacterized protein (TIGR00645 family)
MNALRKFRKGIEEVIEYSVFASRWFQAIVYTGLIVGSCLYTYKFMGELWNLARQVQTISEVQMMIGILGLIDISMVLNLLTIVIIGGYSIFTSRLDFEGKEDKPDWLNHLDADRLKVKLSTSLASISGVHLLKTFIDVHTEEEARTLETLDLEIIIHLVFIFSALALAFIVKILAKGDQGSLTEKVKKTNRNLNEIITLVRTGKTGARSHIKNLIRIAAVDGNLDSDEQKVLISVAKMNNISMAELSQLQKDASGVKMEIPTDPDERFFQFYDLILMMSADQLIHKNEMRLCELFAKKFGYRKEIVKDLIEKIRQSIQSGKGPQETLELVTPLIAATE